MTENRIISMMICGALAIAVLDGAFVYAWAQGGNGGDNIGSEPMGPGSRVDTSIRGTANPPQLCNGSCNYGGGGSAGGNGALDSHGQVNGGGTGSADGGLTQGGPR